MSYAPETPTIHVPPTRVDADTYVIHQVQQGLGAPVSVYLNSMLITGAEPAIIDTGSLNNRSQWMDDVFGIVQHDCGEAAAVADFVLAHGVPDRVQAIGLGGGAWRRPNHHADASVAQHYSLYRRDGRRIVGIASYVEVII